MRLIDADELMCKILKEPLKTRKYGRVIEIIRTQPTARDVEIGDKMLDSNKVAMLTGAAIQDDYSWYLQEN